MNEQDFYDTVNDNINVQESKINTILEVRDLLKQSNISKYDQLINLTLYSTITNIDLVLLTSRKELSTKKFETLLYTRILALISIEYLDDINGLINKLRIELDTNKHTQFIPPINKLNSEFARLKESNQKLLRYIRNNTAAHKSKDAFSLVNDIINLQVDEIFDLSMQLIQYTTNLTNSLNEILLYINNELKDEKTATNSGQAQ